MISFWLHAVSGAKLYSAEQASHGGDPVTVFRYIATSRFWFESFQNWQSEFLAIGSMVIFSIFLREKNSPESKALATPNGENE